MEEPVADRQGDPQAFVKWGEVLKVLEQGTTNGIYCAA
jgi:hypothetical protein